MTPKKYPIPEAGRLEPDAGRDHKECYKATQDSRPRTISMAMPLKCILYKEENRSAIFNNMIYTIDKIKTMIRPIAEKYHLPAVYIFGSYTRNEADEDSDIDLLVDVTGTDLNSLFAIGALYNDLETIFNKKIDLITMDSLEQETMMLSEQRFKENVLREKIQLYAVA